MLYSKRFIRLGWKINEDASLKDEIQRLEGSTRPLRLHTINPDIIIEQVIDGSEASYSPFRIIGHCIYCGSKEYNSNSDRRLGDEHIIPAGMNGVMVLPEASCEACERKINVFEQNIQRGILKPIRYSMGLKKRRRKDQTNDSRVYTGRDIKDPPLRVLIDDDPSIILMPYLRPPKMIAPDVQGSGVGGFWHKALNFNTKVLAEKVSRNAATSELDLQYFFSLLAKIAHGYSFAKLNPGSFEPLLNDIILNESESEDLSDEVFDVIGGIQTSVPPTKNIHEVGISIVGSGYLLYSVVRIRLFAKLGSPVYYVVSGKIISFPPM
jgi:hypothetical protein